MGSETSFLNKKDPSKWTDDENYLAAQEITKNLKFINDSAERGVKITEDFNNTLTKDEKQKQYLLQVVAEYRKKFPD